MSEPGSLVPISDEQAKAVQEALKTLQGLGGFLRETFGTVPEDLVGLFGGNWLKVRRAENFVKIAMKAQERLEARKVNAQKPRLSLLLPLIEAAADEEAEELQDMWARLLAAAADPDRAKSVRLDFIDTVKRMDPLDAAVLKHMAQDRGGVPSGADLADHLASRLQTDRDEVFFSLQRLYGLGCLDDSPTRLPVPRASPKGRLLVRVVGD
jgi:hypothetical protein